MAAEGKWWMLGVDEEFSAVRTQQLEIIGDRATVHRGRLRTGKVTIEDDCVKVDFPPTLAEVDGKDARAWTRLLIAFDLAEPMVSIMLTGFTGIDEPAPWSSAPGKVDIVREYVFLYRDPPGQREEELDPLTGDEMPF